MMHKLKEYMDVIKGDKEKEQEVYEYLWWGICKLKQHDEGDYNKMMMKVHCVVNGPHFDESMAKKAVSQMRNVDGTDGQHWTMEETNKVADQYNIKYKCDWYYALNSLYSDLYGLYGTDVNTYAKIAKALYFDDPDKPDGKLFKMYMGMVL